MLPVTPMLLLPLLSSLQVVVAGVVWPACWATCHPHQQQQQQGVVAVALVAAAVWLHGWACLAPPLMQQRSS